MKWNASVGLTYLKVPGSLLKTSENVINPRIGFVNIPLNGGNLLLSIKILGRLLTICNANICILRELKSKTDYRLQLHFFNILIGK